MARKVELVISGLDLNDDQTDELLAEKLSEYGWFSRDGVTTAAVYLSDSDAAASAACEAAHKIENLTGAQVLRVDEDLVGISDIAYRTGLHRETVRLMTLGKRGPGDFPSHRGTIGAGSHVTRVWRWDDVLPWLHEHYGLCEDERPISSPERAQINAHLARVVHDFDDAWTRSSPVNRIRVEMFIAAADSDSLALTVERHKRRVRSTEGLTFTQTTGGFVALGSR